MTVVAQGSGTLEAIQRPKSVFQRNVNLVRELSITSFKLKYTGSALGYVWSLVKPLMLFGIMYLVFSVLLRRGERRRFPRAAAHRHRGVDVLHRSDVDGDERDRRQRRTHPQGVLSALDPRRRVDHERPADVRDQHRCSCWSSRSRSAISTSTWRSLLAPLYFLEMIVLVLGLSMLLSSLFVFFRDLGHIWEILRWCSSTGRRSSSLRAHPKLPTARASSPV